MWNSSRESIIKFVLQQLDTKHECDTQHLAYVLASVKHELGNTYDIEKDIDTVMR